MIGSTSRSMCACSTVFLIALAAYSSISSSADARRPLFSPLSPGSVAMADRPHVLESRLVAVDRNLLVATAPRTRLNFGEILDLQWTGVVDRKERRGASRFTVSGVLEEDPLGFFVIVAEETAVAGIVHAPAAGVYLRLDTTPEGKQRLSRIDPNLLGGCGVDDSGIVGASSTLPVSSLPDPLLNPGPNPDEVFTLSCSPPPRQEDLMIVYTRITRIAAGGTDAVNAECQLAVDVSNVIYANSEIPLHLRLVYRGQVSYNENGTYEDHLARLTDAGDGVLDEVHYLRNVYGADLVTLFVEDATLCGLAHCRADVSHAFSVVTRDCSSSSLALAHELGHNQGCAHDRDNDQGGCGLSPYSFGYHFEGLSGDRHRTVMAYPKGTNPEYRLIQHFSNPYVVFDGVPTGEEPTSDFSKGTLNAATIAYTIDNIEWFRLPLLDIWVEFGAGGLNIGTYFSPYPTVAEGAARLTNGPDAVDPTLWIKAGSTSETLTIDKRMILRACGGSVVIGAAP